MGKVTSRLGSFRSPAAFAALARRRWRTLGTIGVVAALVAAVLPVVASSTGTARAATRTTVSLTFDDGTSDQTQAASILARHTMKGTFYIISGDVGAPGFLTRADLNNLTAAGNEIGAHTVTHPDLTTLPAGEVAQQVCNSRADLSSWGFAVRSFAYPYAAYNATAEAAVKNCGFNSGRGVGDAWSAHSCGGCVAAERLPPPDPYALRTPDGVDATTTLADLQKVVTHAESNGGGLVTFTFHRVCASGCGTYAITPTLLDQFTTWLASPTRALRGTAVKTVGDTIGGTVQPVVTAPPSTNTTIANPSLETGGTASTDFPQCWFPGGWGTNTVTWSRSHDAHSGQWAEQLTLANYTDGDAKLLSTFDLGTCTPTVNPGQTYTLSTWYKSTTSPVFVVHYRNTSNAWIYAASSPAFAPVSTWTQAQWQWTAPADASAISFGLSLASNGTLTTDDYGITPVGSTTSPAPNPTPTTTAAIQPAELTGTTLIARPAIAVQPVAATRTPGNGWRTHHNLPHPNWGPHQLPYVPGSGQVKPGTQIPIPAPPGPGE